MSYNSFNYNRYKCIDGDKDTIQRMSRLLVNIKGIYLHQGNVMQKKKN